MSLRVRSRSGYRQGFTLIEVMIAVVIVAILISIALPLYLNHIDRSRRVDAQSTLFELGQLLERCYTEHNRFDHASCNLDLPRNSPDEFYVIDGTINQAEYTLTATPTGIQATRDGDRCSSLTLNHLGQQLAQGTQADRCWG